MSEEGKAHQPIFCQEKDNFLPTPVRKNYQEKKTVEKKKAKSFWQEKSQPDHAIRRHHPADQEIF